MITISEQIHVVEKSELAGQLCNRCLRNVFIDSKN